MVKPGAWVEFPNPKPGGEWIARWYDPGTGERIGAELTPVEAGGKLQVPLPTDKLKTKILWGGPKPPTPPKTDWYAESESDLAVKVFKVKM